LVSTVNLKAYGTLSDGGFGSNLAFSTTNGSVLAEKMRITSIGNVGIGTTTPWRTLSVTGTVAVNGLTANSGSNYAVCINNTTKELTADVGGACNPSSERFKNNIEPLSVSATDIINSLKPSSFAYNDIIGTRYGLIAEQVSSIDPHLATYEEDGITPHGLDTSAIISVLVKAVQELTVKLNTFITEGIASVKDLVVETLTATVGRFNNVEINNGLQMIDEVSGEKYCVKIRNGDWSKVQGNCNATSTAPVSTSNVVETNTIVVPEISPIPTPSTTSTSISSGTATSTTASEIIPTETSTTTPSVTPEVTPTPSGTPEIVLTTEPTPTPIPDTTPNSTSSSEPEPPPVTVNEVAVPETPPTATEDTDSTETLHAN
jgi:hypothetical protein